MNGEYYTPEEVEIIEENYRTNSRRELAEMLPGRTPKAINSFMKRMGWRRENHIVLTEEQQIYIRANYSNKNTSDLSAEMGISQSKINNFAFRNKLKKSPELLKKTHSKIISDPNHGSHHTRLQKGNVPKNKGKRWEEYTRKPIPEGMKKTQFKKGNVPVQHREVGSERVEKDGYIYIKIAEPNQWQSKHRYIWEQHNGEIPTGCNVQFRDGNRENFALDNLYLISRAEQLKNENSMYVNYPKEIQLAIQAKGALKRQINKIIKENGNESHND
ncbi:MAG: HNH endonuclease [Prevotellaceae bacterium]|jgi:hypothetical protein|nr:HNH endonuclease [Prevotellaceae bacterium]